MISCDGPMKPSCSKTGRWGPPSLPLRKAELLSSVQEPRRSPSVVSFSSFLISQIDLPRSIPFLCSSDLVYTFYSRELFLALSSQFAASSPISCHFTPIKALYSFLLFLLGMEKEEEEEKHLQDILTAQVQLDSTPPPPPPGYLPVGHPSPLPLFDGHKKG